ncbi:hypothetical protein J2S43_003229 [Catenuloplanes nepalensis]|uniref:DUF3349 domain-containing protein n=1 Tax=Catenuloplanes nepalensis TaxID=587533 RepID=A0ABT9MTG0_9ACTN|nr:hypothetical protein [Catenuloplanes nepalensis]MDP9794717.1 hypothetical protein [Catenuloplanes nepalensis]
MTELLRRAFPGGLGDEDYPVLFAALYEDMSDEQLSKAVARFSRRERLAVWNDIPRVMSDRTISRERVAAMSGRLRAAGWVPDEGDGDGAG